MPKVVSNVQKSTSRPQYNPPNGVDLRLGEQIIFEHKGETWTGFYCGWKLDGERALVKTDLFDGEGRADVPIENVWRVRDARDEELEILKRFFHMLLDTANTEALSASVRLANIRFAMERVKRETDILG